MRERGSGTVVNVSSVGGQLAMALATAVAMFSYLAPVFSIR
jgi:hypothetical protein